MMTRAAETVDAIGQLTGPALRAGALEKSSLARRAVDLEHDLERDLLVRDAVVVHHAAADVPAVRQLLDVAAHDGLAVVVHPLDAVAEHLQSVALDKPDELATAVHARRRPRR